MEIDVNKKIAFHTLGCKVNTYETEAMMSLFENDGYDIVSFDEKADIYVINTCSVTNIAEKKSRQMIHRARKMNPDAVVIATGCYTEGIDKDKALELGCDRIIGHDEKNTLVAQAAELIKKHPGSHTRAAIKIEDGCNQFCSYCIIPYKRGRVYCRPMDEIVREAGRLAEAGHKEIVLTGIHISSYGADNLIELMKQISEIPGIKRIRLGSLEPRIVDDRFLSGLKENKAFCPHFHLSLQSGCDKTLRAMNRHYTADEYRKRVELIRDYFEHPAITTDVIAGFPGETEEDFAVSLRFVKEMKFYMVHIFPYSRRAGTRADRMEGQLTMAVKQKRAAELEFADEENSALFTEYYSGKTVEVLTEEYVEIDGKKYIAGHTPEYVKVLIPVSEKTSSPGTEEENGIFKGRLLNRIARCRIIASVGKDAVVSDDSVMFL